MNYLFIYLYYLIIYIRIPSYIVTCTVYTVRDMKNLLGSAEFHVYQLWKYANSRGYSVQIHTESDGM